MNQIFLKEVEKNNGIQNTRLYNIIGNKVYDVTDFQFIHPGGKDVFRHTIEDKYQDFKTICFHTENAWKVLDTLYIGDLIKE